MDRKVTQPPILAPAALGWRVGSTHVADFAEAQSVARHNAAPPHVALPTRFVLLERLTLPATDPEELEGMILLQLEKSLPYPVEEIVYGFETLASTPAADAESAGESTVIVSILHLPTIELFLQPMIATGCYPSISLWARQMGATLPADRAAAALWQEEEEVVFGVFEKGRLVFTEITPDAETLLGGWQRTLMAAELAGAAIDFSVLKVSPTLASWGDTLGHRLGRPVEPLDPEAALAAAGSVPDLTPASWKTAIAKVNTRRQRKRQLLGAVAVYGALLLLFFGLSGFRSWRINSVSKEIERLQPEVDLLLAQQQRWNTFAPVTDRRKATVEILNHVTASLPSPEVRITQFDQTLTQIMITGEAPSASLAVTLLEALKAKKELEFDFTATPPTPLADERAQFRIFGK